MLRSAPQILLRLCQPSIKLARLWIWDKPSLGQLCHSFPGRIPVRDKPQAVACRHPGTPRRGIPVISQDHLQSQHVRQKLAHLRAAGQSAADTHPIDRRITPHLSNAATDLTADALQQGSNQIRPGDGERQSRQNAPHSCRPGTNGALEPGQHHQAVPPLG